MPTKFEKLLDYLINEEMEKANELFHDIVVEKSRTIYENLIAQEAEDEEMDETSHGHVEDDMYDEVSHPEMEDESVYELADDKDIGDAKGDASDEFVDDVIDTDAMDGSHTDDDSMDNDNMDDLEPASKEDVMDIKDALEELKAEFEALLAKDDEDEMEDDEEEMEDDEEEMEDDEEDMEADEEEMEDDEEDMEDDEEEMEDDEEDMEEAFIREYRELVEKDPLKVKPEQSGVNTHSPVNANPKNRPSGGNVSAHNIAQGGEEGKVTPAKPKGQFVEPKTLNVDGTQAKGYSRKQPAKSADKGVNSKSVVP